jgi:hypothetical protein
MRNLTAYIEKDPETNLYVGIIPGLPRRKGTVKERKTSNISGK